MKTTAFICLFCLMTFLGQAQLAPAKIYLVRNGLQSLGPLQFLTTLNPDKPIKVKNNGYALIETDADSLGIIRETTYSDNDNQLTTLKRKPIFVTFEQGKSYYFKIGGAAYSSHLDVEEMTERAFLLYVGLNDLGSNFTKYTLSKSGGLVKNTQ